MPAYGRSRLAHWLLDPDVTYLNHGTVGATPKRLLEVQHRIREDIERHPARVMLREVAGGHPAPWRHESRLREAVRPVAAFLGAEARDMVFVANVTVGMNAVLQSMPLQAGDEVLMTSLAYGAIVMAARVSAARAGATVQTVDVPFPPRAPGDIIDALLVALSTRTKLVVVDHVTAMTALILPVAEIAELCHARGIPVAVDGAHAPGSIDVDITALGVDWYAANLHKWAYAPRTTGFLWARPDRQAHLHHPVVSWGRDKGFLEEFENHATHDPTGALSAPAGIALLEEWDWPAARDYMHGLARQAGALLCERWGTSITTPASMVGAMITVPLPAVLGSTDADAAALRLALLEEDRIEVQLHAAQGRLWVRVSCQVYNEIGDIERLADAVGARVSS